MKLKELRHLLGCEVPESDTLIVSVTEDSRRVVPGAVFVATRGEKADGHDYVSQAAAQGAVAVIGEREGIGEAGGLPYIRVPVARRAAGILAHALAGRPTEGMTVIGVTGTNGKSSTVTMVQHVLNVAGHKAGCFGTLGYEIGGEMAPARHTTPFGEELAEVFRRARANGCTHVAMEVSSHALEQERVAGITFSVAAFTNLTQDHLDFHRDMDSYLRAKLRLFESLQGNGTFGVVNADDPAAKSFVDAATPPCYTFGERGDCRAASISADLNRSSFVAETPWGTADFELALLGRHNIQNALCVIAIAGGLGVPLDTVAEGLRGVRTVPGRFERVDLGQPFQVVVDYAHTDDGLRNVLQAARAICPGRVICVFGCGGDRDRTKRPKMGRVAAELSDFAFVTSDNPRSEEPVQIMLDIEVGVQRSGKRKYEDYLMVVDREEAIQRAIEMAEPGDLVMIAGKGHEDYQIIGGERRHFDDREVARAVLESL